MTPRHQEKDKEEIMHSTYMHLLEAAADEFSQFGFTGANVNRIAKEAGFSIGTFYNYFPSKRKLMFDFIEHISNAHVSFIMEQVTNVVGANDRVVAFFKAGFQYIEENLKHSKAIFNALNGPDEEFRTHLFQAYLRLFQLLHDEIIGVGIKDGTFRKVDQASTSNLIMLIYLGAGSQLSPEGKLWITPEQVADFVFNALKE